MHLPAEFNYIRALIGYADLFGKKSTWGDFLKGLRAVRLEPLIRTLSYLNSVLHVKGVLSGQDEVINQTFDADLRSRLESVDSPVRRSIYSPPQILLTMKAALLHSPQLPDDDDYQLPHRAWVELLLMATDLLDDDESSVKAVSLDAHEELREWLSISVHATLDHDAEPYVHALGRASLVFTRLCRHDDLTQSADFIDLDQRFNALTGISIDDYFAIGWGLVTWFHGGVIEPHLRYRRWVEPERFFSSCHLDPLVVRRIVDGLTLTHETAKLTCGQCETEDALFARDFVSFMQRPLFRTHDSCLIPISLWFLESRVTNGVYWILFDSMNDEDRRRLARFYGQVLEAYVRETIQRMLPTGKGLVDRVFSEFTYTTRTGERKTSDIVALYPGAAIFFEVTSARWRLGATRLGDSPAALEEDFDRIILKKVRQLDARIADFRRGHYQFGEVSADQLKMIIPVIVTGESVPVWSATRTATQRVVGTEGLLDAPTIGTLHLIGVEELEMMEPLVNEGETLLAILQAHADDEHLRNVSMRNFINSRYHAARNETLAREYDRIANRSMRVLFSSR